MFTFAGVSHVPEGGGGSSRVPLELMEVSPENSGSPCEGYAGFMCVQ